MLTLSTLSFALSSVFAKYVHLWEPTSALEVTFYRFAIGFTCTLGYIMVKRKSFVPKNTLWVILRALSNTAGVILFYFGVAYTTVSKATLLNMTYPAFVLIAAPLINREKFVRSNLFWLFIIFIGMYLIISPDFSSIEFGDIISLGSGIAMALSVTFLREAGKSNDRYIILFYLMSIGLVINTVFALPLLSLPGWGKGSLLFLSGLTGFLGQYFATTGYMHIEAALGSLVSVSRILFSVALGVMLFDDPLTLKIVSGGLLIVFSLAWMSGFFGKRNSSRDKNDT
jgi:drug/metabolite transporter (DMT)-like permease